MEDSENNEMIARAQLEGPPTTTTTPASTKMSSHRMMMMKKSRMQTHQITNQSRSHQVAMVSFVVIIMLASRYVGAHSVVAAAATTTTPDKEIIVLNSTNFNSELMQLNHPFPHIKLVEYYLPYCGICLRFKKTYSHLGKDIHTWRNVIRPAAIDLGISSNSPIAQSLSIDVVPTLRIHPPPARDSSANRFGVPWSSDRLSSSTMSSAGGQSPVAQIAYQDLGVTKYTNDSLSEDEKMTLLRGDLLAYIEQFVRDHPDEVPRTWPNLRPVAEKTLAELTINHPRQQLFLIIESYSNNDNNNNTPPGPGLETIMELSSSPAWKAARYVRAIDNKELVEDLFSLKKQELNVDNEQVNLLSQLLAGTNTQDNFILIQSESPSQTRGKRQTSPAKFQVLAGSQITAKAHESALAHFIQQTYVATQEDNDFYNDLNNFESNPTLFKKPQATATRPKQDQRHPVPYALNYIIIIGSCLIFLIVLFRCASYYIERQRKHKARMLNGVQYYMSGCPPVSAT